MQKKMHHIKQLPIFQPEQQEPYLTLFLKLSLRFSMKKHSLIHVQSNLVTLTTFCFRTLRPCGCQSLHIAKTVASKDNRATSAPFATSATLMTTLNLKWCTVFSAITGCMPSVKASPWISTSVCQTCQKKYSLFVGSVVQNKRR